MDLPERPKRENPQEMLFDLEPDWRQDWWGMPEFSNDDIRPDSRISINFATREDRLEFAKRLGITITPVTDTMWFPPQKPLNGEFYYDGPKSDSRYPVCIPSKGRAEIQRTGKVLDRMGVSYRFFVEETEGDLYKQHVGEQNVVVMPFHDLGQGSIPARNFIWNWAREREFKRHWVVDDNIESFKRAHLTRRLKVRGGKFFNAMEDYIDRYENIVLAGPHQTSFVMVGHNRNMAPITLNSRIYSCICIDTKRNYNWRGRYNEDTDLSLRVLKDGYCTILFNALLMNKAETVGVRNKKPLPGGNTDNVYNTGDHRRAFAESLRDQHPDCVEVVWKFNRWHHQVDYSRFKRNKPVLKPDVVPTATNDEYGMRLVRKPT